MIPGNRIIGNQGPSSGGGGAGGYTYGSIDTTAMLAIATPSTGETCYNTDWEQVAWYDGQVWLCHQAVRMTNRSSGTLNPKDTVRLDTFTDRSVETTTSTGSTDAIGIVIVGGAVDAEVVVAIDGIWTTVAGGSIFKGDWIRTTTTAGRVSGSGATFTGAFAQALTSASSGGDVVVIFKKAEAG